MTASPRVVIGADTHLDSHHVAVITDTGKPLADTEFPTSQTGYDDAVRWAQNFGTIVIAGVDVPWQLWQHHNKLKMSLEEVKRELREMEID